MCQLSQVAEAGIAPPTLSLVSYILVSQQAKENSSALDSFLPAEAVGFSNFKECREVYEEVDFALG